MHDDITAFAGWDVHKDSIAIAVAAPGRATLRFVGTTGPLLDEPSRWSPNSATSRALPIPRN